MTLPRIINSDSKKNVNNEPKLSRKLLSEKNVVCDLCNVRFTQRKALYVHLRNKHNIEPLEKKEGKVQCPECKNMFYDKYNLKRHCRTAHGVSPTRDGNKIILRGRIVNTNRKPKFIQIIEENYSSVGEDFADVDCSSNETQFMISPTEVFICDSCKSRFSSKPDLIHHINNVHTEFKNLRCVECRENFSDKESLLQHTHPIENYNTLERILPETYKYEVDKHVQISDASFVSEIYCNLSSREDAEQWLDKFQRKNKVTFRNMRRQCRSFDQSYVFFVNRYRCQHNTLPKRRSTPHAKHTGCSATLFIRVYQNKHIPQLSWSRIRIKHTHNHHTEAAAKFRDPVEEVVNKFRLMFEAGKGPKAALNEHIRDLQLSYGDDVISDRGLCPTSRWVYNFYQKLTKQRFEIPVKKKSKPLNSEISNQVSCEAYSDPVSPIHLACDKPSHENPPDISCAKDVFDNSDGLLVSSMNLVSTLNKYPISHSNIRNDRISDQYPRSEYYSSTIDMIPASDLMEQEHHRMNSCLVEGTYLKSPNHVDISKRILHDFEQIISQIRSRVSTNPIYFLNAMKNFIQTYNSTLHTQSSLNSALYSFGKYSEFQIN